MSKGTVEALINHQITPAQFWIRHIDAWTSIADVTSDPVMDEMYRDLSDIARDLSERFAEAA